MKYKFIKNCNYKEKKIKFLENFLLNLYLCFNVCEIL